jgi:hypothetical protein
MNKNIFHVHTCKRFIHIYIYISVHKSAVQFDNQGEGNQNKYYSDVNEDEIYPIPI